MRELQRIARELHPELELTERELIVAEIGARRNARVLRRVILAVSIAILIGGGGTTLGWVLVSEESQDRAAAINESRESALIQSCLETNERSQRTVMRLDEVIGENPTARQRRSQRTTRLLIRALAPYRGNERLRGEARRESEIVACRAYAQRYLRE